MLSLLADIAALSPKVSVTESRDGGGRVPAFSLARPGEPARVTFAGLPMGHEFTSLVLALLQVGGYPPKVEQAVIDQIKGLDGDFEFVTYISLSCQNCRGSRRSTDGRSPPSAPMVDGRCMSRKWQQETSAPVTTGSSRRELRPGPHGDVRIPPSSTPASKSAAAR